MIKTFWQLKVIQILLKFIFFIWSFLLLKAFSSGPNLFISLSLPYLKIYHLGHLSAHHLSDYTWNKRVFLGYFTCHVSTKNSTNQSESTPSSSRSVAVRSQWARLRLRLSAFFPNLCRKTHTRPQPASRSLSAASAAPETQNTHITHCVCVPFLCTASQL